MTEQRPIPMPLELFQKLCDDHTLTWAERIQAAYAIGADQELEACCEWLEKWPTKPLSPGDVDHVADIFRAPERLRNARRPNLANLKKQALESLNKALVLWMTNKFSKEEFAKHGTTIRRALGALPDA